MYIFFEFKNFIYPLTLFDRMGILFYTLTNI